MNNLKHSLLSPSSAERWMNCTGSVKLVESLQEVDKQDSAFADAGAVLHDQIKQFVENNFKGKVDPKINLYTQFLETLRHFGNLYVEITLMDAPDHNGKYAIFGTPDAFLVKDEDIIVVDYKSGFVDVTPEHNYQLSIYAALIEQKFLKPVTKFIIVTPTESREWSVPEGYVKSFWEAVKHTQKLIAHNAVHLKTGFWCQFCPAKNSCPEYLPKAISQVELETNILQPLATLGVEQLERIVINKSKLINYIEAAQEKLLKMAQLGVSLENFELGSSHTRRKWKNDIELEKLDIKYFQLKSLTEIEKFDPDFVQHNVEQSEAKPALVKKQAVNFKPLIEEV
jgi:CRISPR/Cas system-associated exonuclease Cas4 (RecB family)